MPDIIHLHPIAVHFPIALLTVGIFIEIVGVLLGKEDIATVGKWNMFLGAASLILVVATGLLAEEAVEHSETAHEIMSRHKNIGIAVFILFGSLAILRGVRRERFRTGYHYVLMVFSIIGVLVMTYGAFLGSTLVYEHGIAVASPAVEHDELIMDQGVPLQESEGEHSHGSHDH